jgi:hypothetical protein
MARFMTGPSGYPMLRRAVQVSFSLVITVADMFVYNSWRKRGLLFSVFSSLPVLLQPSLLLPAPGKDEYKHQALRRFLIGINANRDEKKYLTKKPCSYARAGLK